MKRDKALIFIISLILPIIICCMFKSCPGNSAFNLGNFDGIDVSKTLLGVWATLLGFIITATSILVTMDGKEYMHAFRDSDHYSTVILTYGLASFDLLAATIFGITVIFVNTWTQVMFYLLVYFILSTLFLLFFCILFLFFMITKSTK